MRGVYRRLSKRWGKRTAVLLLATAGVVLCVGGGEVYARLGGSVRPSTASDIDLQKGLVGWWKMDGNGKDSSPYRNTGTIVGATLTTDRKGRANSAYSFNGTSQYIETGVNGMGDPHDSQSVSAWIYPTSNTNDMVITDVSNRVAGAILDFSLVNGDIQIIGNGGLVKVDTGVSVPLNEWHHLVYTAVTSGAGQGNSPMCVYLDGQLLSCNSTFVDGSAGSVTLFRIGYASGAPSGKYFFGKIDDVRYYHRVLSAGEIKALYDQYGPSVQAASGEKGLVGWWKLDGNAKDSSPNRNSGTVAGATLTADRKGRANSAYDLSGSSSSITMNTFTGMGNPHTSNSFSAWIYPRNGTGNIMLLWGTNGTVISFNLNAGALSVTGTGGNPKVSGGSVALNQWHHVAYTYDATGVFKVYLDGQQAGVATNVFTDGSGVQTIYHFTLGTDSGTGNLNGKVDDARYYARTLSASEIAAQYNSYDSQINLGANPSNTTTSGNINAGLVGYWNFNGNAKDSSPYRNNGTVTGATLATDRKGRASSAYSFDGSSNYISLPASAALNVSTFSYSLWYYLPTTVGNFTFIGSSTAGGPFLFSGNGGLISDACANGTVFSGGWHHLVYTHDNATGNIRIYSDGAYQVGCGSTPQNYTFGNLQIGVQQTNQKFYNGMLDDVRIYNRVLSDAEVTTLYQSGD